MEGRWHGFCRRRPQVTLASRTVALLRWTGPDEQDAAMNPVQFGLRAYLGTVAQRAQPGDGS